MRSKMDELLPPLIRVLVIEDNEADYQLIHTLLERDEAEAVKTAKKVTGKQGLAFQTHWVDSVENIENGVKTFAPHAIILDYFLPKVEGFEVLEMLLINHPKIPIIMLTGGDSVELGEKAIRKGAQDYLEKNRLSPTMIIQAIHWGLLRVQAMLQGIPFAEFRQKYQFNPDAWERLNEATDKVLKK